MSKYNYAPGAIHIDHHKDLSIDVNSLDDAIRLMSAFMSDRKVEDVTPEETTCAKNAHVNPVPQPLPFLVPEKLEELELYTIEQFAAMYRDAVESDAHTLADFLHKYEKLGVFDFRGYEKKEIHETLMQYFPTMKAYSYTNFIYYF